jgi:hypothetical protein
MLWAEIGAKRPNYGQNRTVRWHRPCTVRTVPFKHTVLASHTVQIRYRPLTVKKAVRRRSCTTLTLIRASKGLWYKQACLQFVKVVKWT